ncbi:MULTISPECIES: DUF397 domain-containing protein [unclassified Streptomyces]|uniref:DUF397 domain-containing protein n=1 Tax=unclassified Streptomyces TaxID=2593676 RepID=UPI0006AE3F21|nr:MULTISPECIES: DUF397 domain-containing protein [unclassified Streptomyces]KOX33057.1 hypothetical protein ADL06_09990 [Streptomyces sp. NRRL F-6491]KOX36230.1 hypothetical protein ADL08_33015 [Streptomyces sp. NRRL F-6492]
MSASPTEWQKSSFSGGGGENCVELKRAHDGAIKMRESDDPNVVVSTTPEKLAAFIAGVKAGEFDHLLS